MQSFPAAGSADIDSNFRAVDTQQSGWDTSACQRQGNSGRVPGKVILTGEHGVVYGARALATPLSSKHLSMTAQRHDSASAISMNGKNLTHSLLEVVRHGLQLLQLPTQPVLLRGRSDITIGAGLGSSAAFCVSIVRALANLFERALQPHELARAAGGLEAFFHGRPSGLDTTVVAFAKAIMFRRGEEPSVMDLHQGAPVIEGGDRRWPFILIDSTMRSSTKVMISTAVPAFKGAGGDRLISSFDAATMDMSQAMQAGDWQATGEVMLRSSALLGEIGVINDCLGGMMRELRTLGGIASKPTGAGGGGFILALLDPRRYREQLHQVITRFGKDRVIEVTA